MHGEKVTCVVMFVDIAGSTHLFEVLGDTKAQRILSDSLDLLSQTCRKHGGTVIKTIGDEIMTRFSSSNDAVTAACRMQEAVNVLAPEKEPRIAIRVGLHLGQVLVVDEDVFGDAVNVAARITAIAKAGQIITTEESIDALAPDLRARARMVDRAKLRGRQEESSLYEIVWEPRGDVTSLLRVDERQAGVSPLRLLLRHRDREISLDQKGKPLLIGRGSRCDLVVNTNRASRVHARIEFRRGKFVLTDESTNGTFVHTREGRDIYLRREELPLWGTGVISLGQAIQATGEDLIQYSCRSASDRTGG